ncbi:hypothetical protein [Kutzneria sp. NPDC051319]|uniref:hypothetical protein n=1 Tax=Kutzneria sp. NPDC051319 TaxID=3155047 RepID=UPI0034467D49
MVAAAALAGLMTGGALVSAGTASAAKPPKFIGTYSRAGCIATASYLNLHATPPIDYYCVNRPGGRSDLYRSQV